jgi:epoxyqueuosine reductase
VVVCNSQLDLGHDLLVKAKASGASLAGIANVASLKSAPSYEAYGAVEWPGEAKSVLVLALFHGASAPELDWWDEREGGTPGNRQLMSMADGLEKWLSEEFNINARPLSYYVQKGGIFLKDAAALAGLGIIGKNNLLVTPEYGPRVRLRGLFIDLDLTSTGPIDFSPCKTCDMPCRLACPKKAFADGSYSKTSCNRQMKEDVENRKIFKRTESDDSRGMCIRYCRACELSCPVAR